jgi:hypothetical protein
MSLINPNSHVSNNVNVGATTNNYPNFLDSLGPANNLGGGPRLAPSPMASPPQHQVNGNGNGIGMNGMNVGIPMNAGQQMDVNMLYQKVMELSEVLKENREKTQGIVAGAEELAVSSAVGTASCPSMTAKPSLLREHHIRLTPDRPFSRLERQPMERVHHFKKPTRKFPVSVLVVIPVCIFPLMTVFPAARVVDLERQLLHERNRVHVLIREQNENTKLIGEYETAVGNIVEMVRNYSYNNKTECNSLALHYNKLLQEEKDAHLGARLEKDHWHAKFMQSIGMLREAFRLRCEEEDVPIRVVAGLQNEVRAYRNALGMEPEKAEEEYGWEILKDVHGGSGDS